MLNHVCSSRHMLVSSSLMTPPHPCMHALHTHACLAHKHACPVHDSGGCVGAEISPVALCEKVTDELMSTNQVVAEPVGSSHLFFHVSLFLVLFPPSSLYPGRFLFHCDCANLTRQGQYLHVFDWKEKPCFYWFNLAIIGL